MKINIKRIIILTVAVILIAAASFLIYKDFFQNNKSGGLEGEIAEEGADLLKGETNSDSAGSSEIESGDNDLQSNNENENSIQSNGADKEDENNNESPKENEERSESSSISGNESLKDLESEYEKILNSGRPSIIVFSYDGDCCASTKKFFDEYNKKAMDLMEDYKDRFDTMFINTGILNEKDMDTALDIASNSEGVTLPSILILDSAGKVYEVISGSFEESFIKNILERVQ